VRGGGFGALDPYVRCDSDSSIGYERDDDYDSFGFRCCAP
jgi:hypothetical protein